MHPSFPLALHGQGLLHHLPVRQHCRHYLIGLHRRSLHARALRSGSNSLISLFDVLLFKEL